jgi:hypothetical protein
MSFLDEYIQSRRQAAAEQAASPDELLRAMVNNLALIANSARATQDSTGKMALGAAGSETSKSQAFEDVTRRISKDNMTLLDRFARDFRGSTTFVSKDLTEANKFLKDIAKSIGDLADIQRKKDRRETTYTNPDHLYTPASRADSKSLMMQRGGAAARNGSRGILDNLSDYYDSRGGRNRDKPRPMGTPEPEVKGGKGGWWEKIRDKVGMGGGVAGAEGGAAKSGGGMLSKLGKLKGPGALAALVAAPMMYEAYQEGGDTTKGMSKAAGSAIGGMAGWEGGAAAGAALGAFGGPLAPITMPVGAVLGGLGGAYAGSEAGDYLADHMVDALRDVSDMPKRISKSFHDDIVPGFASAADSMSKMADGLGDKMTSFLLGVSKDMSEFGKSVQEGASNTVRAVASAPGRAVAAARDAVSKADSATGGFLRKAVDTVRGENAGIGKVRATGEEMAAIQAGREKGEKFRIGSGLNQKTKDMISDVSGKMGVSNDYMTTMAQLESGGNANAVSPTGAVGLYQFTGGTAKQYKLGNRFDGRANAEAAAKLAIDNKKYLEGGNKKGSKFEATPENLYLAHQLGAEGARNLLASKAGTENLSESTISGMKNNYGVLSAADYEAKNREVWASKAKQARATTDREYANLAASGKDGKPMSPVQAAAAEKAEEKTNVSSGKIAARPSATTQSKQAGSAEPSWGQAPQTLAPVVAYKPPIKALPEAVPPEVRSVSVANASEIKTEMPDQAPQVVSVAGQGPSQMPSLDSIPVMISDLGLVLLQIGHV